MTRAFNADRRRLTALRLSAQGIATRPFATPADVVRHMLAMQAQDFPSAKWGVALRTVGATDADVERALADRQIVRSWPMRGTLLFTAPEDLGWILRLTRDRMVSGAAGRHRQLGLDAASFDQAATIAHDLLAGSRVVSRTALLAAFDAAGLSTEGQRGNHLLWYLAVSGQLVFGPLDGKQHSFVLLDEWVASPRALEGDEALAEFVRRYFVSHGPATIRDFSWWSSLTLTQARRGLSIVEGELEAIDVEGTTYYHSPDLQPAAKAVHALPGFDEYVLGYQERSAQLHDDVADRIVPGRNGIFLPAIVVDGEIVGTWKRSVSAKSVRLECIPFLDFPPSRRAALEKALNRYGEFLGLRAELVT